MPINPVDSRVILPAVAKALGLDGLRVKSISLHMEYGKPVTADVTFLPQKGEAEDVPAVLERYLLTAPATT